MAKKFDKLKNRIEAMNTVHEFINNTAPMLIDYVKRNGYKMKTDSDELFKKDADAFKEIIGHTEGLQAWVRGSKYSPPYLHVKICYQATPEDKHGGHIAGYYEQGYYINADRDFSGFPIYDLEEWRTKHADLERIRNEIELLSSEERAISYVTEGR